jgi:hypothetical protein
MHHIFTRCGFSSFFERPPHRLGADVLGVLQFDHLVGQQADGPPFAPEGWLATGQGDQVGFLLAIEFPVAMPRLGAARKDGRQPLFDEGLADTIDGHEADVEGRVDLLIRPGGAVGIRLEQDPRAADLPCRRLALAD